MQSSIALVICPWSLRKLGAGRPFVLGMRGLSNLKSAFCLNFHAKKGVFQAELTELNNTSKKTQTAPKTPDLILVQRELAYFNRLVLGRPATYTSRQGAAS